MKVTLLMAITLDGKIAKDAEHFPDWTEKADKKLFVDMTKQAGVLVMGKNTYDTIGRPLPGRLNVIMSRKEEEWVRGEELWVTGLQPKELLGELEKMGFQEVILAGGTTINTLFAKEELIDEMIVTTSPFVFGKGLGLFDESIDMDLELLGVEQIGERTIKAQYKVL